MGFTYTYTTHTHIIAFHPRGTLCNHEMGNYYFADDLFEIEYDSERGIWGKVLAALTFFVPYLVCCVFLSHPPPHDLSDQHIKDVVVLSTLWVNCECVRHNRT